jgi:hypothetical protein
MQAAVDTAGFEGQGAEAEADRWTVPEAGADVEEACCIASEVYLDGGVEVESLAVACLVLAAGPAGARREGSAVDRPEVREGELEETSTAHVGAVVVAAAAAEAGTQRMGSVEEVAYMAVAAWQAAGGDSKGSWDVHWGALVAAA